MMDLTTAKEASTDFSAASSAVLMLASNWRQSQEYSTSSLESAGMGFMGAWAQLRAIETRRGSNRSASETKKLVTGMVVVSPKQRLIGVLGCSFTQISMSDSIM